MCICFCVVECYKFNFTIIIFYCKPTPGLTFITQKDLLLLSTINK